MITIPEENNAVLTPEETAQINEASLRLANLQNEILIATKFLNSLKNDSARISKEKSYEENGLNALLGQVTGQEAKLDSLNEDITGATAKLTDLDKEISEKKVSQETKDKEFSDRENRILEREDSATNFDSILAKKVSDFTTEKEDFKRKVEILKKVISVF